MLWELFSTNEQLVSRSTKLWKKLTVLTCPLMAGIQLNSKKLKEMQKSFVRLSNSCYKWEKLLTLHSDAFLRPVFHFSGEDSTGPHTDHVVSQVELKRVEAKHFNPEKPNFHRWVRALKHQRNLQGNRTRISTYSQAQTLLPPSIFP